MNTPVAPASLQTPQRQSLMAIAFLAFRTVRQLGVVQLVLGIGFVVSQSPSLVFVAVVVPLVGMVFMAIAGLSWWRYTFRIVDDELRVNRGVLSQQSLSVPLDRIQSVSLEQKLLHRPFGLVQVSLDTAGTEGAEFTIDAVDRAVAHALQRAAADHRRSAPPESGLVDEGGEGVPPPPKPPDRVLLQHTPKRLVTVALTQMPLSGIAVLAPLIAVGDDLRDLVPFDIPEFGEPSAGGWLFWAVPLALLSMLVFSAILNLIRVLLVDWNLTVTATAAGLRRDSGLFSTSSVASSVPRIQRLEVSQSALERVAGLHTVVLHTIGSGDFNVPGCDAAQVEMIRAIATEEISEPTVRDRQVSPAAVFKTVRNTSIAMTLVAAGIAVQFGWWGLLAFLAVPVAWVDTRRRTRLRRWGISDSAIGDRRQFITWTQEDVLFRKANGARVSQTLFERKRDLATVTVHTADGSISIGMVDLDEARAVRDRALFVAETDHHVWM